MPRVDAIRIALGCATLFACSQSQVVLPWTPPVDAAPDARVDEMVARDAALSFRDAAVDERRDAATSDDGAPGDAASLDAADGTVALGEAGAASVGLPRNIIVFMGDGMGPAQLETGRVLKGGRLRLDALRGPAWVATDSLTTLRSGSASPPATDSAAAATAIATGVLVPNGVLSQTAEGAPLRTVLEVCKDAGKAIGLVTTSTFYDASPAAFATHHASRNERSEIARDMLSLIRPAVLMGSGAALFDDPQHDLHTVANASGYHLVRSASELAAWDPTAQPNVLGLFATLFVPVVTASEPFTMTPQLERTAASEDPTLAVMAARAIERLAQDPDGFFLFAEDELFDELGHRGPAEVAWTNQAYGPQAAAFDDAVAVAIDWLLAYSSLDETLIVVLADHETGGYHFDPMVGPSSGAFAAARSCGAFLCGYHTRTPVPVYAMGKGSDAIERLVDHTSTHRLLLGESP